MLLNQSESENEITKNKVSKNSKVLMVAHEIKIVRRLSSNDENLRSKQLRKLKKWFEMRAKSIKFPLTSQEFLRIWKGLYVCMWMSDKPLVQEKTAEDISSLINCFDNYKIAIDFFCCFYKTMHLEWFGIDQWRIDKFLMLARRMIRHVLIVLKSSDWEKLAIEKFNSEVFETLKENNNTGLLLHFLDVYLEELAKVSEGNISSMTVSYLIKPFVNFICFNKDRRILEAINSKIFMQLLWQSEKGREYVERFNAWKHMGFPTADIHSLEKIEDEEEELINLIEKDEETALDPRAGNVDVIMPILPVDVQPIIKEINNLLYSKNTNTSSRKCMQVILKKYETFLNGKFPLGMQSVHKPALEPMSQLIHKKLESLENLDKELHYTTRELKKISKRKRKRFLSSFEMNENVNEDNYEDLLNQKMKSDTKLIKKPRLSLNNQWTEEVITDNIVIDTEDEDINLLKATENKNCLEDVNLSPKKIKVFKKNKNHNKSPTSKLQNNNIMEKIEKVKIKSKNLQNSLEFDNSNTLVINPFAKKKSEQKCKKQNTIILKKTQKKSKSLNSCNFLDTPSKKVKIVLDKNTEQKASEYIRQVKNSPQLPYNPKQQPSKSVLKPNLMPSPINPFYKKKLQNHLNII